jgi:C7-cyclitol 7-kinase
LTLSSTDIQPVADEPQSCSLAINIGGTTVKWATVDDIDGHCENPNQWPAPETPERFADMIRAMAQMLPAAPRRVVVGFPGPIAPDGTLSSAVTLWPGRDLGQYRMRDVILAVWPDAAFHLINDVSAYGQYLVRGGLKDFCVLNIGSGIGCKVYVDGREATGENGRGGEIGHWVDSSISTDYVCDCGGRGHVGALSSGRGALRHAQRRCAEDAGRFGRSALGSIATDPAALTSEQLVAAALSQDEFACDIVSEAMLPLARASAAIHLATGCERFVLVGGFAEALGPLLPELMAAHSRNHSWGNGFDWCGAYSVLQDEIQLSLLGLHHFGKSNEQVHRSSL